MSTNVEALLRQLSEAADYARDTAASLQQAIDSAPSVARDVQRLIERAEDVRERTLDFLDHLSQLHMSYRDVADEMNDGGENSVTLDDLDVEWVTNAEAYAKQFDYVWPPSVGSFDVWSEVNR